MEERPRLSNSKRRKIDVPVRATSDVAAWITQSLADTFRGWGTPTTPGAELVLHTEVVKLFVLEESTYVAEVNLKFSLRRRDGSEIWTGIVGSGATRFGRTLKAENYNEVLSDALYSAFSKLWVDLAFRQAWAGKKEVQSAQGAGGAAKRAPSETLDPEVALKKVLALKEAGFQDDALVAWVRKIAFTRALTADDMLAWKSAGVPQAAIRVAIESE